MKASEALRAAIEMGATQIQGEFYKANKCMCATTAIYYGATGEIPYEWQQDPLMSPETYTRIRREMLSATGIDMMVVISLPDYFYQDMLLEVILYLNDTKIHDLGFADIADILEGVGQ